MENSSGAQLNLFAGDFPASLSPLPGSKEARKTTVISGQKCYGLYVKSSPLSLFVKTLLGSSEWHSTTCYLTWKVKATPANRLLYQLALSVPSIGETGYGSSPVSPVFQAQACQQKEKKNQTRMLPTPTCQDGGKATKNGGKNTRTI